jgi:hypothetical protein
VLLLILNAFKNGFFLCAAAGTIPLLLFSGCGKEQDRTVTELVEQTYPVDPAARLKISNLKGSISIRGAETAELVLRATKKAANAEQLRNIRINVAAESGSVSIATSIVPEKKRLPSGGTGTVDYILIVPRTLNITRLELEDGNVFIEGMEGESVRATVVDGELIVRDCCAPVNVALANGDLDLSYEHCTNRPFVADAQITHGRARITIPDRVSFRARATTETGTIANDFADIVQVNSRAIRKIDMSVGSSPRSELNVRVTSGDITIAAVKTKLESLPATASTSTGSTNSSGTHQNHAPFFPDAAVAAGRQIVKSAPPAARFAPESVPPCASIMPRAIVRPIPVPSFFVEKNGSNR